MRQALKTREVIIIKGEANTPQKKKAAFVFQSLSYMGQIIICQWLSRVILTFLKSHG